MDGQIVVKRKEAVEDGNPGSSSKRVCVENREFEGGGSDVRWAAYTLMGWGKGSGVWEINNSGKEIAEYVDHLEEEEEDDCDEDEKKGYEGDVDMTDNEVDEEETGKEDSLLLRSDFERNKFWELVWNIPLSDFVGDEAIKMNQAMVVYVVPENQNEARKSRGREEEDFRALMYFMCSVRKAMLAPVHSPDNTNYQGMQASFSLLDIREKMINLNLSDQPILGSADDPIHYRLDTAIKGALTVLSLKPSGRSNGPWVPLTSRNNFSGRWRWVGPKPNPSYPQHDVMDAEKAHLVWGVSKNMVYNLTVSFQDWLETEDRHVAALATVQMVSNTVTTHDLVRFLVRLRAERGRRFRVPDQSFSAIRARFQEEERIRYTVPSRAFFYTALDGVKSTVSPAYSTKWTMGKRRSHQLRADCPAGVTVISIVKDAAARLPGGEGTTRDVCVLARDSQYLTVPGMVDIKFRMMVSSALNRLRGERDPSVAFAKVAGKRGMWTYLHRMRCVHDFREDGRQVAAKDTKLNDVVMTRTRVSESNN